MSEILLTLNLLRGGSESISARSPDVKEALVADCTEANPLVEGSVCQPEEICPVVVLEVIAEENCPEDVSGEFCITAPEESLESMLANRRRGTNFRLSELVRLEG
jgi:hypothetical protein